MRLQKLSCGCVRTLRRLSLALRCRLTVAWSHSNCGSAINDLLRDFRKVEWFDTQRMPEPHSAIRDDGRLGTIANRAHFRAGRDPILLRAEPEYGAAMVGRELRPHRRRVIALSETEYPGTLQNPHPPLVVCPQRLTGTIETWAEC